ncbi:MAG: hypothetical protein IJ308_00570 [Clostridia bacterium]|nr:hypothetical protein [Clostridia bacterium]
MKKTRVFATALSACLLFSAFGGLTACGGSSEDKGYVYNVPGKNKLEIRVENFGMGPGTVWLEETADRFAKEVLEKQYGDKVGVYIKIEENSQQNTAAMASDGTHIYFDERASDPQSLMRSNLLLNLDDIVKDETRVGGSLASNIFEAAKGGITDENGSYYALPHYEFYPGIAYNRTTFDSLKAYFAAEDEDVVYTYTCKYGEANFIDDLTAKKSAGPDGEFKTEDDGLPCSLEEFIILCDYIKEESYKKISPITVSGAYYYDYPDYMLMGVWAALAGAEQMRNYYDCTGEIEVIERVNGELQFEDEPLFEGIDYVKKPKTKMVTMAEDGSDGWMGNDMVAKYYAMALLDVIWHEGFFSASAQSQKDHWNTHMDLYLDGKGTTNNSAMLIEGSYWYNESNEKGGFDKYERYVGKDREDLDVAWMSLPTSVKTEGAVGKDACFLDCGLSYAMVNGNIANNEVLKNACLEFLAFCYSEQELKNFTMKTGLARSIKYELSETDKGNMSIYASRLWESRDNVAGSNLVAWSGTSSIFPLVKTRIKLDLNCGVLGDGEIKTAILLKEHDADTVFDMCSLYGDWDY